MVISKINKEYSDENEKFPVLNNISFDVYKNEILAIAGPSGCGKTTLLNILGLLRPPSSGQIILEGKKLTEPSEKISYVFQEESLFPWKTTIENIIFALEALNVNKFEALDRAKKYIKLVGLDCFENFYPSQLSEGMKQRAALARALATEPEILLMDEPLASLDQRLRENLQEEILEIHKSFGCTIILVSHEIEEIVFLANRVIILTPRPAKIQDIISIELPFPREADIRTTDQFVNVKNNIWKIIRGMNISDTKNI